MNYIIKLKSYTELEADSLVKYKNLQLLNLIHGDTRAVFTVSGYFLL